MKLYWAKWRKKINKYINIVLLFDNGCVFEKKIGHSINSYITKCKNDNSCQCQTQRIFVDTAYSCYCKLRLVTPHGRGLRGQKNFDFDNPRLLRKALSGKELHRKFLLLTIIFKKNLLILCCFYLLWKCYIFQTLPGDF